MFKKKMIITATMILCLIGFATACNDKCDVPTPPSWIAPQPIDTLLLGSWELIESDLMLSDVNYTQVITFYENNTWVREANFNGNIIGGEGRWSVKNDTLVMPDFFDRRTGRFNDYTYSLSADGELLSVKLMNYSFIENCWHNAKGRVMPFGIYGCGTYKRLED